MKEIRNNIKIIIKTVEQRAGEYIVYFKSDFMQATFSVYINDNIFGALALHSFAEMIRKAYGKDYKTGEIDFVVTDEIVRFKNKALLDVPACDKTFYA